MLSELPSHILASSQDLFVAGSHEDAVDRCCEMFKAKIAEQKTLKQMTTVPVLRRILSLQEVQGLAQEVGEMCEQISQHCYMLHMAGQFSKIQDGDKAIFQDGLKNLGGNLQILKEAMDDPTEEACQETKLWTTRYTGTQSSTQHVLCTQLRSETLICLLNKSAFTILDDQINDDLKSIERVINFMCEVLEELNDEFNRRELDQQISLAICRDLDKILERGNARLVYLPQDLCHGEYSQFEAQFCGWNSIVDLPFWHRTRDYEQLWIRVSKCFPIKYRSCFFGKMTEAENTEAALARKIDVLTTSLTEGGRPEITKLQAQKIRSQAQKIRSLKEELAETKQALVDTHTKADELQPAVEDLCKANTHIVTLQRQILDVTEHGKSSEQALQKANTQIDSLQKHCKQLQSSKDKSAHSLKVLTKELRDSKEACSECKDEFIKIKNTFYDERKHRSELETRLKTLDARTHVLRDENAVLKQCNEKLQNDLEHSNRHGERFAELISANHDENVAKELQQEIGQLKVMVDMNLIDCYEKNMPKEQTCVVCMSQPATHVFNECGHMIICGNCAVTRYSKDAECPICRQKGRAIKIFQS